MQSKRWRGRILKVEPEYDSIDASCLPTHGRKYLNTQSYKRFPAREGADFRLDTPLQFMLTFSIHVVI